MKRIALFLVLAHCGADPAPPPIAKPLPQASASAAPSAAERAARVQAMIERHDVEAMTAAYVEGALDDDLRKQLAKSLGEARDARAAAAFTKMLAEYEPGKTDDDVKYAAQAVEALATAGTRFDRRLVDALWSCFAKYRPSKTNSIVGTQALHDAILAVNDPSYGDKASVAIGAPVVPDDMRPVNDELAFWQTTALQVIAKLGFKPAAKPLVVVLMTKSKVAIARLARVAITRMPTEAEPFVAAALDGSDAELAKLRGEWGPDKSYVPALVDALAATSLDSARDALIAQLPHFDTGTNLVAAMQALASFPTTPIIVAKFKSSYALLPPIAGDAGYERAQALGFAGELFDFSLGPWALFEAARGKGMYALSAEVSALQSAITLMRPSDEPIVAKTLASLERREGSAPRGRELVERLRAAFQGASEATRKCANSSSCYVKLLESAIASTPNANWTAIKAARMAGMFGNDQTRRDLVAHISKVADGGARLTIALAINHLAPAGDRADADALEQIVAGDVARRDTEAMRGDEAVTKVVWMLRARAK